MNRARAAHGHATDILGARQPQVIPENPQQGRCRIHIHLPFNSIDVQRDHKYRGKFQNADWSKMVGNPEDPRPQLLHSKQYAFKLEAMTPNPKHKLRDRLKDCVVCSEIFSNLQIEPPSVKVSNHCGFRNWLF